MSFFTPPSVDHWGPWQIIHQPATNPTLAGGWLKYAQRIDQRALYVGWETTHQPAQVGFAQLLQNAGLRSRFTQGNLTQILSQISGRVLQAGWLPPTQTLQCLLVLLHHQQPDCQVMHFCSNWQQPPTAPVLDRMGNLAHWSPVTFTVPMAGRQTYRNNHGTPRTYLAALRDAKWMPVSQLTWLYSELNRLGNPARWPATAALASQVAGGATLLFDPFLHVSKPWQMVSQQLPKSRYS